jgi:hypothetical protein
MTKTCKTTVRKLCKQADLNKSECQKIRRKLCPKLPSLPQIPTLKETLEGE